MEHETPLAGGNVNTGVVRIGDTVRRSMTRFSPAVHKLLLHLQASGFRGSPRFLGIDAQEREMLSFLPGETGIPAYIWHHEAPLVAAAKLLRDFHDATLGFVHGDETWARSEPDRSRHEVICHNDFGAYNLVYDGAIPVGVIDFDLAGPGPRLRDVAYAAYWLTPLSFSGEDRLALAEADVIAGNPRLKLFCHSYGIDADDALLDMVAHVLGHMGDETRTAGMIGAEATARLKAEGHLAHWQREAATFELQRSRIARNLRLR